LKHYLENKEHPPKLLIFDLDGTLIDSKRDIASAVNLTFCDLGLPEKPREMIYGYVGNGVRQFIIDAVETDNQVLVDRALAIFRKHYLAHLIDETRLFPGIEQALEHYQNKQKAIVTNKPTAYTDKIIEGLKIGPLFDFVIGGEADVPLKPQPEMLLLTLEALGCAAADAVMIGDSLNDIDAARAAGMRVCGVSYGCGAADEIRSARPDYFVEKASDLAGLF